jgi:oxygen-independent coproporphyrinogen-3 oxidase
VKHEAWREAGFALYLHWPYCQAKCPYCDFNSHVSATVDVDRWAAAYRTEIRRTAAETGPRPLTSIFIGGGTPSLMPGDLVADLLEAVRRAWVVTPDTEITLEANPTSVEAGRFRAYREAGVNRLSLGIQALNDADLRALGRLHTAGEARRAFETARATFERVSFDLIYARQHQTLSAWRAELTEALAMAGDHLSLYQLTIEDGTAFGARHAAGRLAGLPDEDLAADLYALTQDLCETAGLPAYEVSNHARPGNESRHNLVYWRAGDYAGIGPGAHGRVTLGERRLATETIRDPAGWLRAVETAGSGEVPRTAIDPTAQADEYLLMALRLAEGVDLSRYARISGRSLPEAPLARLEELGLVQRRGARLHATAAGRLVLNRVIAELSPA